MALKTGAHVEIGGEGFRLDEAYEQDLGRRCYVHGGRDIFAEQFTITGVPGARNLRQDDLLWHVTNFDGEGQVVQVADDETSARLFYRSEGLDCSVPGQMSLNRSTVTQSLAIGSAAATTFAGNADMVDVSGTSTGSGTDRRINVVGNQIQTSSNHAPGVSQVQVDFYLYRGTFGDTDTVVQGTGFRLVSGTGQDQGTDFRIKNGVARTNTFTSGSEFTAGVQQQVQFTLQSTSINQSCTIQVVDVENPNNPDIIASGSPTIFTNASRVYSLNFTPSGTRDYQFRVRGDHVLIDQVAYGPIENSNTATIEVYNNTTAATLTTRVVDVTATTAGFITGSIVFNAAAATNYRYRITRTAGNQHIWADQIVATLQSATVWTIDCIEHGLGGRVWLGAHAAGVDTRVWRYDVATNSWGTTSFSTLNDGAATTAAVVRGMTHSDSLEYFALSNGEVYTVDGSGTDDRYATGFTGLVGICVAQERLVLMVEGSGGVLIYSLPLDNHAGGAGTELVASDTVVNTLTITAGSKTPNTDLRQRMAATPTGAAFFINYGDTTAKIYEADVSGSTLTYRTLADLGHGAEAFCIAHETGLAWIGGQYTAESDKTPQSALWFIDQNGVPERDLFFRQDSPDGYAPIDIEPYQTDIWTLAGNKVWRRSLTKGGVFLEYQLNAQTATEARALAIQTGRTFAAFEDEIFATGTQSTYRQSSVSGGNTYQSSIFDFGLPGIKKTFKTLKALTKTMPTSTQVRLAYALDGAVFADATTLGLMEVDSGAEKRFTVSSETNPVTFNTLQLFATLNSLAGTATPTLKGLIASCEATEKQEYFDLVLRVEDQDPFDRIPAEQKTGEDKAHHLINLWRGGIPTTFRDGYESLKDNYSDYLVTISDFRDERNGQGEGRIVVTLRVVR